MIKQEFEFVIDVEPDEETLIEFHKALAKALIKKYGEATMREVVKQMENQEKNGLR